MIYLNIFLIEWTPHKILNSPIKEIGNGVTHSQLIPLINAIIANIIDNIFSFRYEKIMDRGPDNKTVNKIIVTNSAKDAMLLYIYINDYFDIIALL